MAILRTLTSSKRTQNRNTPFTTEARVVRQTHSGFLLVGQVPLYACAVASALWESCPVTRSPSCGGLHRRTVEVEPVPPPTCVVSSSTCLFGWTDHGAVTASSGALRGRKDHTDERSGLCHLGRHGFFSAQGCPKAGKTKIAKLKK